MEESALANSPFGKVPAALIPNILRFTDFKAQEAFSRTCKPFNKWAYICSKAMYEEDRPARNTRDEAQKAILLLLNERLKARHPREFKRIDKKINALSVIVSSSSQRYVDTHSTLFARTFIQTIERDPRRFLQKGRPSKKVLDAFYLIPQKIMEAIDEELNSDEFKYKLELIELSNSGQLAQYVSQHREELAEQYETYAILNDLDVQEDSQSDSSFSSDDSQELDSLCESDCVLSNNAKGYSDEVLYNYILNLVKEFTPIVQKLQSELPLLKVELSKPCEKSPQQTAEHPPLQEPEINSGPSSPHPQ